MEATTVKVKPLEWEYFFYASGAKAQVWNGANYLITKSWDGRYEVSASYPGYSAGIQGIERFHPTLDAAKAAAQADYEARILSAIDTTDLDAHIGAVLEDWKSRIENLWITADNDREEGYDEGLQAVLEELPFVRPDAQQAIERVKREARVAAITKASELVDQTWPSRNKLKAAILNLIKKPTP